MLGRMWQASRRALNLEHSPAHQFACSQWQTSPHPSTTYLIYRLQLFIFIMQHHTVLISGFIFVLTIFLLSWQLPGNVVSRKINIKFDKILSNGKT